MVLKSQKCRVLKIIGGNLYFPHLCSKFSYTFQNSTELVTKTLIFQVKVFFAIAFAPNIKTRPLGPSC